MQALVLVEIINKQVDKTFTYKVPNDLEDKAKVGIRVTVPFGSKKLLGLILKVQDDEKLDYEIKEISELIDLEPVLNDEMLKLGEVIAKKTFSTLMAVYQTMLPKALKAKTTNKVNKKYNTYVVFNKEVDSLTEKQKSLLELIRNKKTTKKEAKEFSLAAYKKLLELECIKEIEEEVYRLNSNKELKDKEIVLNEEQQTVVDEVVSNIDKFIPYLLWGVTGSGKTEVYMHVIEEVLVRGKEALVLVPEISLTPQLTDTFKARFGNDIAIMHSRLSDGERYDEYRKILRKEVKIVIGARSAVFAPLTNIGVIIIDEEHSQTYKQENNPMYSAIDIALYRARNYNIPVIMGSATPSIEAFTLAKMNNYKLLTLKNRVNKNMPKIKLIDMKESIKNGYKTLSKELISKINNTLSKDEQVILLLNRRGYSTITTCSDCGYVVKCPNCDIPLIYHKSSNTLRCHYCGHGDRVMKVCPNCNSTNITQYGMGTQKLEEEVNKLFESARTIRMDLDTTSTKNAHEKIIDEFRSKKYNILIGTQMIAKGLDFEDVTLVGVINGDASLNIPDYRSAERTFQLLNQVSGRSGRGSKSGYVVIQSFNIDHYSIVSSINNDYETFYNEEMNIRRKLKYPPFYNLTLIKIKGKNYDEILNEANKIKKYLETNISYPILGPVPASMLKVNNIYHIQIIIKHKKTSEIYSTLEYVYNKYKTNSKIIVDIDFNPTKI